MLLGRLSLSVQGYKLYWAPEMFSLDPHGLHIIFIGNGKKRRQKNIGTEKQKLLRKSRAGSTAESRMNRKIWPLLKRGTSGQVKYNVSAVCTVLLTEGSPNKFVHSPTFGKHFAMC